MALSPRFPAEKLAKYPHMAPLDVPIWDRFIEKHGADFLGFDYDFRCGTPRRQLQHWPKNIRADAAALTMKRIDAVGYREGEIWIIEIKPRATASAIGQTLTYTSCFKQDHNVDEDVVPCIVTDRREPDMNRLTKEIGIVYIVI